MKSLLAAASRAVSVLVGAAVLGAAAAAAADDGAAPRIAAGPITGDVRARQALVWARTDGPGWLHVELSRGRLSWPRRERVRVDASRDFTGRVAFDGLRPDTAYRVRVWATAERGLLASRSAARAGHFRTAPREDSPRAVRIAFGGDVAGQNVCRDAREGFPIFEAIADYAPDLFVGLGDMIYADDVCRPVGRYGNPQVPGGFPRSSTLEDFRAHWRYARADGSLSRALATAPYVAVWDDHEVVNDSGPLHDTRRDPPWTAGVHLLPIGLRAFLEHNPVSSDSPTPRGRLYRALRWGRHAELFVLDTRQYRDANSEPDRSEAHAAPLGDMRGSKTLLGREQRAWLERRLAESDATWKIVVSSVPMSIPTGAPADRGRDGWADFDQDTGFETELRELLAHLQASGVRNCVWITTDVHFAQVLRYTPFPERDPGFQVHEVITGPLNAMVASPPGVDDSLHPETLFRFAPATPGHVRTWEDARGWFNFGALEIAEDGRLTLRVLGMRGQSLFERTLAPASPGGATLDRAAGRR